MKKKECPAQVGQAEMLAVEFLRWVVEVRERVPVQIVKILEAKVQRDSSTVVSMRGFPPRELRRIKVRVVFLPLYHNPGDHVHFENVVYESMTPTVLVQSIILIDREGGQPCVLSDHGFELKVKGNSNYPLHITGECRWRAQLKLVDAPQQTSCRIPEIWVFDADKATSRPRWTVRTSYRDEGRKELSPMIAP